MTRDQDLMTPAHPRWEEFCSRLEGPEGCNFVTLEDGRVSWWCDHRYAAAFRLLREMGLPFVACYGSIEYFRSQGDHCDCEIVLNLGCRDAALPADGEAS